MWPTIWWPQELKAFWDGPTFRRLDPFEVGCEELCYSPVYAYVARIADISMFDFREQTSTGARGNVTVNTTISEQPTASPTIAPTVAETGPIIARAAISALALQAVVDKAGLLSRGHAFMRTLFNTLIASSNMADIISVDEERGTMKMKKLKELDRDWARKMGADDSSSGGMFYKPPTRTYEIALDGPTRGLGEAAHIIMAVKNSAFVDPYLLPLLEHNVADDLPISFGVLIGSFPLIVTSITTLIGLGKFFKRSKDEEDGDDKLKGIAPGGRTSG
jgi:hypothetical protein